jgi:hypothetical protein
VQRSDGPPTAWSTNSRTRPGIRVPRYKLRSTGQARIRAGHRAHRAQGRRRAVVVRSDRPQFHLASRRGLSDDRTATPVGPIGDARTASPWQSAGPAATDGLAIRDGRRCGAPAAAITRSAGVSADLAPGRSPPHGDPHMVMLRYPRRSSSVAWISLQNAPELLDRQWPVEPPARVFLGDVKERQTGSHS